MTPTPCLLLLIAFQGGFGDEERLELYGNGRLRWESTFNGPGGVDRHRARMRGRFGARYRLEEGFGVEARLSTASDGNDANNPHWDFGDGSDGFNGSEIVLDRYFVSWEPLEKVRVRGGKQPHAFQGPPVLSELVWDADVQPSGLSAVLEGGEHDFSWDLRSAAYVAVESGSGHDATMVGAQAGARFEAGALDVGGGVAFYGWGGLSGFAGTLGNQGNTSPTRDFQVLDTFLHATLPDGPLGGVRGFVQFIDNTATGSEDQGFAVGCQVGSGSRRGDLRFFLSYYDLEADCLFSPVAQDDTPIAGTGAGTGMRGLVGGGQYFVRDGISLKVWALTSDTDTADPLRVRFDLDFKVM